MKARELAKITSHEVGSPQTVPTESLLLDVENPRLASAGHDQTQDQLAAILWKTEAVDELAGSIAHNGYFPEEPLFVIQKSPLKGKPLFIVVEGNRRLAAVKLLLDDHLRSKLKIKSLPTLSSHVRQQLSSLPVYVYPDRKMLWKYLSFRHINGAQPWDALSKAEYIAKVHDDFGMSLDEISRSIGDYHSTVLRLYKGYRVLVQAENETPFGRTDRIRNRFYFSHLYTAIDQAEFKTFLGLDGATDKPNPVPSRKRPELYEFMTWLYGSRSKDIQPIVQTQSPDLGRLRAVIGNQSTLAMLRSGSPLEVAYAETEPEDQRFRAALANAKVSLENAKRVVALGYRGEEDLLLFVDNLRLILDSLIDEMKTEPKKRRDRGRI